MTYHYVLSGYQGHDPVVLKLGIDQKELSREASALRALKGHGVVDLLSEGDGFLLLEAAVPGLSLNSSFPLQDEQGVGVIAGIMRTLHQARLPPAGKFPGLQNWLIKLDAFWDIPLPCLEKARSLRDALLETASSQVLLHGDLHHGNILQGKENWVAIDPKGVIGDPVYEAVAFILNPMEKLTLHPQAADIIHHRINVLSELINISPLRLRDWCFVQSVLGWAWALEDGVDVKPFQKFVDILAA